MFTQQSEEYIRQIGAEVKRLEQLRDQVRATIQSEAALEDSQVGVKAPRKRSAKNSAGKKAKATKVPAKSEAVRRATRQ